MYSTWWLIVSVSCKEQLAQFTTERQPVLRPEVAFFKTSFKHRSVQIKGNFTKLTLHLYFKCIMYYAGLLFCSVYCQLSVYFHLMSTVRACKFYLHFSIFDGMVLWHVNNITLVHDTDRMVGQSRLKCR